MLSTIIDTYNTLPGWAAFLMFWPLPSTLILLFSLVVTRIVEKRNTNYMTQEEVTVMWVLSLIWPLFVFVVIAALWIEIWEFFEKHNPISLWQRFSTWANNQQKRHQMRIKLKQQPKTKQQKEYIHFYENTPKPKTRCGVGNPREVHTTNNEDVVTCPVCLFLLRRDLDA